MSPLDTPAPRADGADGLTPDLALALGGTAHRSRRRAVRAYPPMSVQALYLWHETQFHLRVLNTPVPHAPDNTIMLSENSFANLFDWINAAASCKMAHLRVPSSGRLGADLPPIIDGFPYAILYQSLLNILRDEYRRADKIVQPDADDDFPFQRPADPTCPIFEPCLGKFTLDERIGGVYDLVQEVNDFNLVILQAVARFIRAHPSQARTVFPTT